jgi:ribosome-associated protein
MPIGEADLHPLQSAAGAAPHAAEIGTGHDVVAVARHCLEDMKAEETVEIDLAGKTSLADTMIITSGRSHRHVASIAERVIEAFKASGIGPVRVEGMPTCDWVLIDAGDLIIHVFRPEVRGFYNLEKMWGASRPNEGQAAESPAERRAERLAG